MKGHVDKLKQIAYFRHVSTYFYPKKRGEKPQGVLISLRNLQTCLHAL